MNGKTKDEYAEASRKVVLIHASSDVAPFTILCKTDRPNQAVTGLVERITCPDCQRILTGQEPVAVPPHVKAIDARRAAEMCRPGNEKLAEWSQEISLILHWLEEGKTSTGFIRGFNHGFVSGKLERLQAEIVEAMGKDRPICPTCHSTGKIEYGEGLSLSVEECPDCLKGGYR